ALAAEWYPQQEGLDYNLGLAHYKSQSYKQAAPPLENEIKDHPGNRPAIILLGITLFRLGNYARAAELLSGAIASRPADIDTYYALAASLIRQRKLDLAEPVIAQIKGITDDAPQLALLSAEKYDASGDRTQALAELNRVATSVSNAPLVHYYAGLLYLKLDKREEALKEFERELVTSPNDISNRYVLGETLLGTRNVDRGLELLREVVQARPNLSEARFTLGKALLKRRELAGAIENLERAATLEPESPEIHYELGQAYIAGGRKADGKTQIDLAKQYRSRSKPTSNDQ
ncbi:MAG TPA: tetratricopeptide repeat protein, partial [Pyrinomonadaceae bacterium]|nr:tetratricopeptide repeat protein [Pyrinomonadaceae bacterium]